MANEENLVPFKKGYDERREGNGRKAGVPNSRTRLLRILELVQTKTNPITGEKEEFTIAEQLDMVLINKALKGDLNAYKELFDRLEGRAKQTNEIELSGGLQINWEEKKTYVENKSSL